MQTDIAASIRVARQFGSLVAKTDYSSAHALLTKETQKLYSANDIRWTVESMTASVAGTIQRVELDEDLVREDWPDKQAGDITSVLVRLIGDQFVEPVTIVLAKEAGNMRIRQLGWDRHGK